MDLLDRIGKTASKTCKYTADKTCKIAKKTKIRMNICDKKANINDIYLEIGRKVYENHIREEDIDIEQEIIDLCEEIDELSQEIEDSRMEILNLRNKKQCPNCFAEIKIEYQFCPSCGQKQNENEQSRNDKIIDRLDESIIDDENETEAEIVRKEKEESNNEDKE